MCKVAVRKHLGSSETSMCDDNGEIGWFEISAEANTDLAIDGQGNELVFSPNIFG